MVKRFLVVFVILIILLLAAASYFYGRLYFSEHGSSTSSPTPSQTSQKTITFPKGGETLNKDQLYTLTWTPGSGKTQIFLISDALASQGASVSVADRVYNIDNSGSYPYHIPQNIQDGEYHFTIGNLTSRSFTITSSTGSQNSAFCLPQDIQAGLTLSPGAGNVYGTFTIKNISERSCQVTGNQYISANYDTNAVSNIQVTHIGTPEQAVFTLTPGQTIYSQLHYPNGPQCSGPTKTVQISYSYALSEQNTVTFTNQNNTTSGTIPVCQSAQDMTTIQIWNISQSPITPQ